MTAIIERLMARDTWESPVDHCSMLEGFSGHLIYFRKASNHQKPDSDHTDFNILDINYLIDEYISIEGNRCNEIIFNTPCLVDIGELAHVFLRYPAIFNKGKIILPEDSFVHLFRVLKDVGYSSLSWALFLAQKELLNKTMVAIIAATPELDFDKTVAGDDNIVNRIVAGDVDMSITHSAFEGRSA